MSEATGRRKEIHDSEIQHCTHEHPLIPRDFSEAYTPNCQGCTLPTLSLGYDCIKGRCSFAFHIPCAQASREKLQEHPFHPSHPLTVLTKSPYPYGDKIWCGGCGKSVDGFFLHCAEPDCKFDLHIVCSQLLPVVKHYRHEHLLVFFEELNPDTEFRSCITCDGKCVTQLYRCVPCDFNIHSGCVNLPEIVKYKEHDDPLTLKNKYIDEGVLYGDYYCDACEKPRDIEHGVYLCADCEYITHIDCALAEAEYTIPEIVATFHSKIEEKEGQKEVDTSADREVAEIKPAIEPTTETNSSRECPEEIIKLRDEIEAMTTEIMAELGVVMKKLRDLEIKYAK
ncbi:uncharacterized protein LOC120014202 [Tripterygium wilfordii]|uniref:uncharacterized protein LOC120014202 n=1 Tax=Tripterygium wilfordii TaxID=458696 RepID=UPI0018F80A5E|nr:uncharacterized protein LOC120014202 [Tripterygium wilfordii]